MNKTLIKKEVEVSLEWLEQLISENSKNMIKVSMYSEMSSIKMLWFKLTLSLKENGVNEKQSYIVKFPPRNDFYPDWLNYDLARDKILTLCRRIVGWDNVLVADDWSVRND